MDALDKWTITSVTLLVLYGTILVFIAPEESPVTQGNQLPVAFQQYAINPELDTNIQVAKNLLVQDSIDKAESLINSLISQYPYKGELYMLKGDIMMHRQQPVAAMHEYKEAVGLNPDFIDKKAKLFQGKKIKNTVDEALAAIENGLQENPGNSQLKDDRELVYYMKRKLAGSCG